MRISILVVALAAVTCTLAQDKPKPQPEPRCPNCNMVFAKKKDKSHTVAVRLKKGGPILWCCASCKMSPKILVKPPVKKNGKS